MTLNHYLFFEILAARKKRTLIHINGAKKLVEINLVLVHFF